MEPALVYRGWVESGGLDARQRLSLGTLRRDINRRSSSAPMPAGMLLILGTIALISMTLTSPFYC